MTVRAGRGGGDEATTERERTIRTKHGRDDIFSLFLRKSESILRGQIPRIYSPAMLKNAAHLSDAYIFRILPRVYPSAAPRTTPRALKRQVPADSEMQSPLRLMPYHCPPESPTAATAIVPLWGRNQISWKPALASCLFSPRA